jgi:hypothetical protein
MRYINDNAVIKLKCAEWKCCANAKADSRLAFK